MLGVQALLCKKQPQVFRRYSYFYNAYGQIILQANIYDFFLTHEERENIVAI